MGLSPRHSEGIILRATVFSRLDILLVFDESGCEINPGSSPVAGGANLASAPRRAWTASCANFVSAYEISKRLLPASVPAERLRPVRGDGRQPDPYSQFGPRAPRHSFAQ